MSQIMTRNRIGRTPLVRAVQLEKLTGISEIYFKLEGNNPSGHSEDRLAYLIIRDALSKGKNTICMGTYGVIGGSLSALAPIFNIKCKFYIPSQEPVLRKKQFENDYVQIIPFGRHYQDCVEESRRIALENDWYNATPGQENNTINMCAFSFMAEELKEQMNGRAEMVFCQTSNGFAISGLNLGFREQWIRDEIEKIPRIIAVTTAHGNAIYESFRRNMKDLVVLDTSQIHKTRINQYLVNPRPLNGQDALNALYDSEGEAISISDHELLEFTQSYKKRDHVKISSSNFYPIAGFMKYARNGGLKNGKYVIILDDGHIDIEIRSLHESDFPKPMDHKQEMLDQWLGQYSDPQIEISEALKNTLDKGFVFGAYLAQELVGIAVIINTGFAHFATNYHLAYVATRKNVKGRGIATQLFHRMIEETGGNLSLHVDFENHRAIRLYQKMGFKKCYARMIHQIKAH